MKEDLKRRLARYIEKQTLTREISARKDGGAQKIPPSDTETNDRIAALRKRLAEIAVRQRPSRPAGEHLAMGEIDPGAALSMPGGIACTSRGDIWLNETRIDLGNRYGGGFLMDALSFNGETARLLGLGEEFGDLDPRLAVYLDTETSGLELSTATIPFLIGVGAIDGHHFTIRQIFLDRIDKERDALMLFGDLMEGRGKLVTFNGRAFDVPLLKTRYIFNRIESGIDRMPNLDLLQVVRRIYKRRIKDCSLVSCEREVLGYSRENDIPSEMIPGVYVSYLRESRAALMPLVFHHNLQDLVAMVALMGSLALLALSRPEEFGTISPDDLLSLARAGSGKGSGVRAEKIWNYASESCDGLRRVESLVGLAKLARRRQDYIGAAKLLEMAIEEEPDSPHLRLMLSKIYEHDIEDYEKALSNAGGARGAEEEERWRRRMRRIEEKMVKRRQL